MKPLVIRQTLANTFGFGFAILAAGCLLSAPGLQNAQAATVLEAAQAVPGQFHKLRVTDAAIADELTARGARLIADYGSFKLFEAEATAAGELAARAGVEVADELNSIQLNAQRLDTSTDTVKALRVSLAAFSGKRLHLVHFAGPVKPEWRAALETHGAQVVTYLPQNAYLIYGDTAALGRMQGWAATNGFVQWEGAYLDEYKIHPRARAMDAKGQPQKPLTDTFAIQLVDDAQANAATLQLIDQLKLAPIRKQSRILNYLNVIVRLPVERVSDVAARPEVVSIQPYFEPKKMDERQDQILAGNLAGSAPSGPGYLAWLAGKGFSQAQFTASGFAVDVSDSGIDNGTATPGHFGLYPLGDSTQTSRVLYNRLEGAANAGSTLQGCDGHGNLNSHIIAGYNNFTNGFPHADAAGFCYDLGVCPFVKVGSSVIFDPNQFTSPNYADLESRAYNNGARISANSWGADTAGAYDVDAQSYDALVRDAQPPGSPFPTAGNQQMVIVFAAGNAGSGVQTVGSPGTAKNVITVGASENVRSLLPAVGGNDPLGNDGCSTPDSEADSANDMAVFSSRGPCSDGRSKPDLVAPGTHISGGVAQNSPPPLPTGTGSAISCFAASGVCGLPGGGSAGNANNFFPLGEQFYTVSTGTSHSTPAVAGACALLRQYLINNSLTPPSPAMTKAYLMNSTRYLTGVGANDTLWSQSQGMGEVDLGTAFDGTPRILRDQLSADKFTVTGQTRTFAGTITDPTKPLRVTLAWTDAPGSTTASSALVNDLDLTVAVAGNTYKGNVFSGASSVPGGSADHLNNVENMLLQAGLSGNFIVTVTAANITADGVTNGGAVLEQDFALVLYNATPVFGPVVLADSYSLAAEGCAPTNGAVDPNETVTVNFALKNLGTANTTNLVATLQATDGVTPVSGPQTYGALAVGGAAVARAFSFTASGTCGGSITATLQLQDGATNLGTGTFTIPLGQTATIFSQNFDGVTAPALPPGWTTSASGAQSAWVTTTAARDTAPNAAFSPDPAAIGVNALVSPLIPIPPGPAQLSFRHNYSLESGYDGGVLEIKFGSGSFTDILTAGGSFATGGYTRILSSSYGNPLAGRQAWSGSSGGFVTTTVNLPAAAAGQYIQLRWRCGSDRSVSGTGWYVDTVAITAPACCGGSVFTPPLIVADTSALLAESCTPTNGAIDPGETVIVNFGLKNISVGNTSNLVATLQAGGGVIAPGGAQNYGVLASGGAAVARSFAFTAGGLCGGTLTATLQLQDGLANLGAVAFPFQLGQLVTLFAQNFDGVTAPALPAGWTTSASGAQSAWVTSKATADTLPNSAFSPDPAAVGVNALVSAAITLPSGPAQLVFRNSYDLEAGAGNTAFDGGVLEIKIGAGAFTDIINAGGGFVSGGYDHTVSSSYSNPLAGRQAWSGNSGGFITTIANLPASASGQMIQLQWRCGSDSSVSGAGWYVDSIAINAAACCVGRPLLLSPQMASNGNFNFTVIGSGGFNYQIEGSTNLSNWTAAGTVSNATGQVPFADPAASNFSFRFYRAKLLP